MNRPTLSHCDDLIGTLSNGADALTNLGQYGEALNLTRAAFKLAATIEHPLRNTLRQDVKHLTALTTD